MTPSGHRYRQPAIHDLAVCVRAPVVALAGPDGQIRATGAHGVYLADYRVLGQAVLRLDDEEPLALAWAPAGPGRARFLAAARGLGDPGPDPSVQVDRLREVTAWGMAEEIRIDSTAATPVRTTVTVELAAEITGLAAVKSGHRGQPVPLDRPGGATLAWRRDGILVTAAAAGAGADPEPAGTPGAGTRLRWTVELPPHGSTTLRWELRAELTRPVVVAATGAPDWSRPVVTGDDPRLAALLARALDDLESLRLADPRHPADRFIAAGVPWFLTLFGRDSLWAARMLLPLGTGIAAGTLRTLARRQGRRQDPHTGEAPGKIMHELRRDEDSLAAGRTLPATYYGTVDATPLWISLLHDAWRWGLPAAEVDELLPALRAALEWLERYADADGDGFLEYLDTNGRGLANQGWKDSGDSVRYRDGRIAPAPIALCEVQGYAHRAALDAAALLDAFDQPGADHWRGYASDLAARFRDRFWATGPLGRYPVLALDGDKCQVDSLTSNIGHLLDSGLLTGDEIRQVAALLGAEPLAGGYGLRTMSTVDAGYDPLSYHCGSVWPHDTAIAVLGLVRGGQGATAGVLISGLLAAATAFDHQLPELYGGHDRDRLGRPVPYPAACRPQAWAATAAVTLLQAALGVSVDVPAGVVHLAPPVAPPHGAVLGALTVRGLRIGTSTVDIAVDRAGRATLSGLPPGLRVRTAPPG